MFKQMLEEHLKTQRNKQTKTPNNPALRLNVMGNQERLSELESVMGGERDFPPGDVGQGHCRCWTSQSRGPETESRADLDE